MNLKITNTNTQVNLKKCATKQIKKKCLISFSEGRKILKQSRVKTIEFSLRS